MHSRLFDLFDIQKIQTSLKAECHQVVPLRMFHVMDVRRVAREPPKERLSLLLLWSPHTVWFQSVTSCISVNTTIIRSNYYLINMANNIDNNDTQLPSDIMALKHGRNMKFNNSQLLHPPQLFYQNIDTLQFSDQCMNHIPERFVTKTPEAVFISY